MCLHVDLQTGSLVFQCLPITADAMPIEGCFNVKTTQANTRNHHIPGHSLYSRDAVHRQKKNYMNHRTNLLKMHETDWLHDL